MTISLCMIVKDEESVLSRCLSSVSGLFDEIILVDTGSSDQTPAIAASKSRRMPGRADDCEPDAIPQSGCILPPLGRENPAPGFFPSELHLENSTPAIKKAPGPSRRPLSGFEFTPRR